MCIFDVIQSHGMIVNVHLDHRTESRLDANSVKICRRRGTIIHRDIWLDRGRGYYLMSLLIPMLLVRLLLERGCIVFAATKDRNDITLATAVDIITGETVPRRQLEEGENKLRRAETLSSSSRGLVDVDVKKRPR